MRLWAEASKRFISLRLLGIWHVLHQDWEYIPGILRLSTRAIFGLLPGNLQYNQRQPSPAQTITAKIQNSHFPALLNGIFAKKSPEFDDWNKEDWICDACLNKFLRENLIYWLLEEQRQGMHYSKTSPGCTLCWHRLTAGDPILEDCWYGYNCRTQTHRPQHAAKLNVCKPSCSMTVSQLSNT